MIILVSGKQRAGKNYVCEVIEEITGGKIKQISISESMKKQYARLTGIPFSLLENLKNSNGVIRSGIILLAESRRLISPFYWLENIEEKDNFCVSDHRFIIEQIYYAPRKPLRIRVNCDREIRAKRGTLSNENHYSETELDSIKDWDFIIDGSQSKEKVKQQVIDIFTKIKWE